MKKVINLLLIVFIVTGLVVTSCQDGTNKDGFYTTESGLQYKFYNQSDDTASPKEGQFIDIDLVLKTKDSVLFDTRDVPSKERTPLPMGKSMFKGDIFEGIEMMHIGDSATFAVVADSVWKLMYRGATPPKLAEAEYVYYDVKLNNIVSREEMNTLMEARQVLMVEEAEKERVAFLAEKYPDAQPTASGLYYIRTAKGTGKSPQPGQLVKVHYTGKLLDGTQFDSSAGKDPIEFPLGQGRVIRGWDEGIGLMKKGEKGVLVIPSDLGYGNRGSGKIPPFATLVFNVELVDFRDAE